MDDLETRKARRIEQMVAKWLRRSRDNAARGRASVSDRSSEVVSQPITRIKLTVDIQKDALLGNYGFEVSQNPPLLITAVAAGSAADGKLLPGDHILAINNETVEDVTGEQAAVLLRDSEESTLFTVLRCISGGPKSSFLTAEKRARLKTNPAKVRFAEEVVVNGHTQVSFVYCLVTSLGSAKDFCKGSSLLCMPNVLKVYLENGQTKAFKFETNTTVKDIILTLKEKLSIRNIDHFALVLEEQYNVLKMYLLHEDELIQQVVQRKESHDYRCLFRVCFIPKDPLDLLQQDSIAFEYLYLQSCSDVLQERFAVEMKCSVALRLAALHIQERIITCAQPQKVSLKYIEKDWGIENFISPTLLRNMRGKDIKKAISFHMKRNQLLLDPRPKHLLSAAQVRLCYLQILGDLKLYGGKIFNATLMLQDRESCVALLVGAKYGISQVVNNKLNIVTMLAEFANISRVELTEESEKVSMVKIYLQDVKLLTLLLESNSAKDLACLVAGYYRLLVDSSRSIFVWEERKLQTHRLSAEEGYESRTGSDSEESSGRDSSLDRLSDIPKCISPLLIETGKQEELDKERKTPQDKEMTLCNGYDNTNDSLSEASDSANTESQGFKTSGSSDSLDALEEDDLEACSSSRPEFFHLYTPTVQELTGHNKLALLGIDREDGSKAAPEYFFSFLPSLHTHSPLLPQPDAEFRRESEINVAALESKLAETNVMEYYSLCASISPVSSGEKNTHSGSSECSSLKDMVIEPDGDGSRNNKGETCGFILEPPPGFGDTSSDDEFYDAAERITPTEAQGGFGKLSLQNPQNCPFPKVLSSCSVNGNILARQSRRMKHGPEKEPTCINSLRKRRSFLQTNYTSQVTFPLTPSDSLEDTNQKYCDREPGFSDTLYSPSAVSWTDSKRETHRLEAHHLVQLDTDRPAKKITSSSEPDALETKAVTDFVVSSVSAVCLQSAQKGAGKSDFALHSLPAEKHGSSFTSSCVSDQSTSFNVSEISGHQMENLNKICNEKAEYLAETPDSVEEQNVASTGQHAKDILENTVGVTKASPEIGVSYVLIEEVIHTTTKPSRSLERPQSKRFSWVPTSDLDPLPMEKHEQLVLDPCDPILHKSSQAPVDLLLQENTNEGPIQNQLGFSNASELLPDCDEASGIPASQSVPVVNQFPLKKDHLSSGVLSQEPYHLSALTTFQNRIISTDLAIDQKSKTKDFTGDVPHVDYKHEQCSTLTAFSEVNVESKKPNNSDEPNYFSLATFCRSVEPNEENSFSNQTLLCSPNSSEDAKMPISCNNMGSSAFTNPKETFSPKYRMDTCSCRLTYANCFCGLDNDDELKDTKLDAGSASKRPLTTPPLTRSPLSLDFSSTGFIKEGSQINAGTQNGQNHMQFPESHIGALSYLKNRTCASPLDFFHLLENVVKLQEILRQFEGNRIKHTRDRCSISFSENKNILCMESQRLMSSCQKVTKTYGPSTEIQNAIQDTFQDLLQLTEVCFQFTNCGLCSRRHKDLAVNLKDLVSSYHQFVQAAKQASEGGCPTLNIKLLVCQYTALTAALFCLVQQFRMSSCVQDDKSK